MQFLLISFITTFLVLLLLLKTRLGSFALDKPNQRSLHTKVVPRTGGLAIMAGVMLSWVLLADANFWGALILTLMIVSLMDDVFDLSALWRLLAQLGVSAGFVLSYTSFPHWWIVLALVLAMTWMINLYNFMDGSDGLAGGMALFGFSTYAIAAYIGQDKQLAMICASIAVANMAFLLFNFHPAKIFMGDAGSVPLGFLAGSIGLYGYHYQLWAWWFPVVVFSPFVVDASVTLFKRAIRGEKVWQAHRSHYYQRLVQLGWGHQKTALAEYGLMLFSSCLALYLLKLQQNTALIYLLVFAVIYGILMRLIDRQWHKLQQTTTTF